MTRTLDTIAEVAGAYDALIFDQWGVLHNGSTPYQGTIGALQLLAQNGVAMGVLSNSGKRAAPNAERIATMGFAPHLFKTVMTSGEALWRDIQRGDIKERRFFPIERAAGDASIWANGLNLELVSAPKDADAVLLMGLPDGTELADWSHLMSGTLPLYCSNPDRASPRKGGTVISPGALAYAYQDAGGPVRFYGKPHRPVFDAVADSIGGSRFLMIGDSLEHDVAGAQSVGWDTLLIQGGLYADAFAKGDPSQTLNSLVTQQGCAPPTFTMRELK